MNELINLSQLTGIVIDMSAMEGSGGGDYPAYLFHCGECTHELSSDIGVAAYDIIKRSQEKPETLPNDLWGFHYGDYADPTLINLSSGKRINKQTLEAEGFKFDNEV